MKKIKIKNIIKQEKEVLKIFQRNIESKKCPFIPIDTINKSTCDRIVEFIIFNVILDINYMPLLFDEDEFFVRREQGFENIFIFNEDSKNLNLRLSVLEVKSHQPKGFQENHSTILNKINDFSFCSNKIKKNREAIKDLFKERDPTTRKNQVMTISRYVYGLRKFKPNISNKKLELNSGFEQYIKDFFKNKEIISTDDLWNDFNFLYNNTYSKNILVGTVTSKSEFEQIDYKFINKYEDKNIESVNAIIVETSNNSYDNLIKGLKDVGR